MPLRWIVKPIQTTHWPFGLRGGSAMAAIFWIIASVRPAIPQTIIDLGTSVANGINANGQVVGYAYTTGNNRHAFLYSGGRMTDLGTLGGPRASPLASTPADRSWATRK